MKKTFTTLLTALLCNWAFGQQLMSGIYDGRLRLSFDSANKKVTGYFEEYTGSDEQTGNPRFSCVFYLEGTMTGQKFTVNTYYPTDSKDDLIQGTMEIVTNKKVKIRLPKEHGGCWNVQPFADKPVVFTLEGKQSWMQIRYVDAAKAYFYSDKGEDNRLKSYLVKGDIVCIEKIEEQWAYCTFISKKTTKGWLKLAGLNTL
jgi:hypothetical protein